MTTWKRAARVAAAGVVAGGTIFAGAAWAAIGDAPLQATRVELTIDGHSLAVFSRCLIAQDVEALREVTCERGLTRNIELAAWHELVALGDVAAAEKSFTLTMYDTAGEPVARWHVTDGYPTELTNYFDEDGYGREIVTLGGELIQRVSV